MYVDVRWIIVVVVGVAAVFVGILWPSWIPALTLGLGVCGLLYIVLRMGEKPRQSSQPDTQNGE